MHHVAILVVAIALAGCNRPADEVVQDTSAEDTGSSDTGEFIEPLRGVVFLNEIALEQVLAAGGHQFAGAAGPRGGRELEPLGERDDGERHGWRLCGTDAVCDA